MSPEYAEQLHASIDRDAQIRHEATSFVLKVAETNQHVLQEILGLSEVDSEEASRAIYGHTLETLNELHAEHTRTAGVHIYHLPLDETQHPDISATKLGWAQFIPAFPAKPEDQCRELFPHVLRATEFGRLVMDDYRASMGLVS